MSTLAEVEDAAAEAVDVAVADLRARGLDLYGPHTRFLLAELHAGIVQTAIALATGYDSDTVAWRAYVDAIYERLANNPVTGQSPPLPRRTLSRRLLDV